MFADPYAPALRPPPPGLVLRRPIRADLSAVAELYASCSLARVGAVTVRRGDLEARWIELGSLHDVLLVEDPQEHPSLVAYAEFTTDIDPWTGALDLGIDGRVHPAQTGRGLGRFLLGRAEDRARMVTLERGEHEAVLTTTVVDGDDDARAFFARRGFMPVRHLLMLRLDLHAAPPRPAWPSGLRWRPVKQGEDDRALWAAHQAAFADVPTHLPLSFEDFVTDRLVPADRHATTSSDPSDDPADTATNPPDTATNPPNTDANNRSTRDPAVQLVATDDHGQIVGFSLGRAGRPGARGDGWIRDLGVVPSWRRRGAGLALLRQSFEELRARGMTGVGLEVDDVTLEGAVALYRRAGMRIVRRTDVLERTLRVGASG